MKIEEAEKLAMQIIEDHGEHRPQVIFKLPDGALEMALLMFSDDIEKRLAIEFIRKKVDVDEIDSYIVIMDAWVGQDVNVRPRDAPVKQEALIITEFCRDMRTQVLMHKYKRDGNKIVWTDREILDKSYDQGSIWNVYVEDCMEERIEAARKNVR